MSSKKICPTCGRAMKQQFVGLYHCTCGTSSQRGRVFTRTQDMVFALEKGKAGKKVPVVKYKDHPL